MNDEPTQAQVDASIDGGYFLFARKAIQPGSWLMDKPPLYMKLWVWMLGRATYQPTAKLQKGQFHTSIKEMQNAMSHLVGYRKKTPTKDEIRSAYEAFAKATMITTTKATRGILITILNYKLYQNPKNYEAHNEAPNAPRRIEKERKKEIKTLKPLCRTLTRFDSRSFFLTSSAPSTRRQSRRISTLGRNTLTLPCGLTSERLMKSNR